MSGRVQVTLDDALYAALQAHAEAQDRTPSNVLKHALRGYLSRSSHGRLPGALRVRATASEGSLQRVKTGSRATATALHAETGGEPGSDTVAKPAVGGDEFTEEVSGS